MAGSCRSCTVPFLAAVLFGAAAPPALAAVTDIWLGAFTEKEFQKVDQKEIKMDDTIIESANDQGWYRARGEYVPTKGCMKTSITVDECRFCVCENEGKGWYCAISGLGNACEVRHPTANVTKRSAYAPLQFQLEDVRPMMRFRRQGDAASEAPPAAPTETVAAAPTETVAAAPAENVADAPAAESAGAAPTSSPPAGGGGDGTKPNRKQVAKIERRKLVYPLATHVVLAHSLVAMFACQYLAKLNNTLHGGT